MPSLVFAGRGGLVCRRYLMRQIAGTEHLHGRLLLVIEDPTDGELAYSAVSGMPVHAVSVLRGRLRGCRSPKSLSFGKPCLIADQPALPPGGWGH